MAKPTPIPGGPNPLPGLEGQWHKIAALLMFKAGQREVVISGDDVERALGNAAGMNVLVQELEDGIHVWLVADAEVAELRRRYPGATWTQ